MNDFASFPDHLDQTDLPPGERIVWQGRPKRTAVLRNILHVRLVLAWFAIFCIWRFAAGLNDTGTLGVAFVNAANVLLPAVAGIALLVVIAILMVRTTEYTITTRRVVMRYGIALPAMVNLPVEEIEGARFAKRGSTGDVTLEMPANRVLAYWKLWPNVRPWRFLRANPALRNLPDAAEAAEALKQVAIEAREGPSSSDARGTAWLGEPARRDTAEAA
ncbi:photosynthetic complex putative assembly protein PuhB [Pararhizobium mangrovi]|uniref:PH domain-containing protein n=1 Tax=Pararhizobium mangrovi TaxID=2590452 RepID=A0A506UA57_9HYPH|nr:photosynthetic complex putative assembly protein PuhB [Pararhizobium mangrovi]TPW30418.1 PH domain-containing protein [Pararhizobium mangrovi]